jgi:hypothetical protein
MNNGRPKRRSAILSATLLAAACNSGSNPNNQPPPTLTISPPGPVTVYVGRSQSFTVVTNPPGLSLVWTSSAPSIVSVDQSGVATAVMEGSATVTATIAGGAASAAAQVAAKWIGPRNPSFEAGVACNTGILDRPACADQWTNINACDGMNACQVCVQKQSMLEPGMPSSGVSFLWCYYNAGVVQDGVDFGPATSMSFDWSYTTVCSSGCGGFDATLTFQNNGTTTLWSQHIPGGGAPLTTTTIPIPPNLGVGRLTFRFNWDATGGAPRPLGIDNIRLGFDPGGPPPADMSMSAPPDLATPPPGDIAIPLGTWSTCLSPTANYQTCDGYCASVGKNCAETCLAPAGNSTSGAAAWLGGQNCAGANSGSTTCGSTWNDAIGAPPRWECCCY